MLPARFTSTGNDKNTLSGIFEHAEVKLPPPVAGVHHMSVCRILKKAVVIFVFTRVSFPLYLIMKVFSSRCVCVLSSCVT